MRDMSLDDMELITRQLYTTFVEPLAEVYMTGEVPSFTFNVYRKGTRDNDWLAKIKLRNSVTVSIFHCDVYLEDIMRFCRNCKIYLITPEIFTVVALYYMIHPIFQYEWIHSKAVGEYESMMLAAGKRTRAYIKKYYKMSVEEKIVLDILKFKMMLITNLFYGGETNPKKRYDGLIEQYNSFMMRTRKEMFLTARRFKAQTNRVDENGFVILEKIGGQENE